MDCMQYYPHYLVNSSFSTTIFLYILKIYFMLYIIYQVYISNICNFSLTLLTTILKWWAGITLSLLKMKKLNFIKRLVPYQGSSRHKVSH